MDGRGSYDIVRCNMCSDGYWVKCSHSNTNVENGISIFKVNDNNVNDRIKELHKIYKSKLDEPEPEWHLYEKKCLYQKTDEVNIHVNVQKLANIVLSSIRLHAGDLSSIATLAQNLTIDMSYTLTQENDNTEVIRHETNPEGKHIFLIMRLEKDKKQRSTFGTFFRSNKFTYTVKYMLLMPKNEVAIAYCDALMNDTITTRIDNYDL